MGAGTLGLGFFLRVIHSEAAGMPLLANQALLAFSTSGSIIVVDGTTYCVISLHACRESGVGIQMYR